MIGKIKHVVFFVFVFVLPLVLVGQNQSAELPIRRVARFYNDVTFDSSTSMVTGDVTSPEIQDSTLIKGDCSNALLTFMEAGGGTITNQVDDRSTKESGSNEIYVDNAFYYSDTLAVNDATPSIAAAQVFYTANTVHTVVTDFDDDPGAGVGKLFFVIVDDGFTTFDDNSFIDLGIDSIPCVSGDILLFMWDGTGYYGRLVFRRVFDWRVLTVNSATPAIEMNRGGYYRTQNTSFTTITGFSGLPVATQAFSFVVEVTDDLTVFEDGAVLRLGGVDLEPDSACVLRFECFGGVCAGRFVYVE